ncbi:MAG: ribosome maturation factor RimP [Thermodesulfobacteriota bacterium]
MATESSARLTDALTAMIAPICADHGLELVAVLFRREAHGQVLRVVIHRPEGVSLDDCSTVSRELGYLLDVEDPIRQAYHLEVTSPGLDWPLTGPKDFARYLGKKVDVSFRREGTVAKVRGCVTGAGEEEFRLATEQGELAIPYGMIKKARLVIEF